MNKIILLAIFLLFACEQKKVSPTIPKTVNNEQMSQLYENDQKDRTEDNIDWDIVSKNDSLRLDEVIDLLEQQQLQTAQDFERAAMIFQHGSDTFASKMAIQMMQKAINLDATIDKWLLAAAIDRHLMKKRLPQIYGTQYRRTGANNTWELYKIDTTKVSDAERKRYNVPTLLEQQNKLLEFNKK